MAILFLAVPWVAAAQDRDDEADPPSRVARLNYIQGSVSFQPAGEQDWVDANPNRPLTTGDNIWVDRDSRGELHIGSTSLRLGGETGISFLNLDDRQVQIQLAQGRLRVHVRQLDEDEAYEVDTPNLAFSILRTGDYRFEVNPNGDSTVITVFAGQGEASGGGRTYSVRAGERAIFTGTDTLYVDMQRAGDFDDFDRWSLGRDEREDQSESARYVSRDVIGYEDLDAYGRWQSTPEYGEVWVPSGVAVEWAPYHYGHWAFIAPWGWTWVEDEPWGFAPFHYGRWAFIGGFWGWVPGPVAVVGVRPCYAPALVGFVGGAGFGVSIGFGGGVGVAWFPLGPRDVFIPAYRVSPRYVEVVNVSSTRFVERTTVVNVYNNVTVNHVTNVNYTYQTNTRAVTAVSRETFVNARPVAAASVRVSAQEIQQPRVVQTAALTPSRVSVVGPAAPARATPPAALARRPLVTKMAPAPAAAPIGRPRPASNPNLAPARVNAAVNGTANPRPMAPSQPARSETGNANRESQPFTPPNRENVKPNRPAAPENQPREAEPANERQPNRPFTPPNRENVNPNARPEERPNAAPQRPEPEVRPERTQPPPRAEQPAQRPQAEPQRGNAPEKEKPPKKEKEKEHEKEKPPRS